MEGIFEIGGGRATNQLISLDTETLGRWDYSIVLSIGAVGGDVTKPVSFEELVRNGFFMKLDAKEQKRLGRKTCATTVEWWRNQKTHIQEMSLLPSGYDESVTVIRDKLLEFFKKFGEPSDLFMADRNLFDFRKLQHIIEEDCKQVEPWDYHNLGDFSSMFKAWGAGRYGGINANDIAPRHGFQYHNPVHDAALDWLRTQHTLVRIGVVTMPENTRFNGLYYEAA